MPVSIEIHDEDPPGVLVPLTAVLSALAPFGEHLQWALLDLEATGDVTPLWAGGVLALEEEVATSPEGVRLTWDELVSLAKHLDQVVNCRLHGWSDDGRSSLAVEAIDSSVWTVDADDERVLQALLETFVDVRF